MRKLMLVMLLLSTMALPGVCRAGHVELNGYLPHGVYVYTTVLSTGDKQLAKVVLNTQRASLGEFSLSPELPMCKDLYFGYDLEV